MRKGMTNPESNLLRLAGAPTSLADWDVYRSLPQEDLFELGFGNWDGDLTLVPGAWHAQLPVGLELESISGKKVVVGTDEIDDDERFGFLAYGIRTTGNAA